MEACVHPGRVAGSVLVPGSKSIAQRALLLAARRGGVVRNVPDNEDLARMCAGLRALGFRVEARGGEREVSGGFSDAEARIDAGDNGTAARCLLALAALRPAPTTVDGSPRLRRRPVQPLCEALRTLGAHVEGDAFPVTVRGPIRGDVVRIAADVSSQFATALVLLVDWVPGLKVQVAGRASLSYVALTAFVQREFASPYDVEPDFSSAAAFAAAAAATRGSLLLRGLSLSSPQPDARVLPILNRLGARVAEVPGGVQVQGGPLRAIRADVADCPDLAPLLAALGALAHGTTEIVGAPHLVHKESDRIARSVAMVRAVGGAAEPLPDGIRVEGGGGLRGGVVDAAGDHRIAMAGAVLALCIDGVTVAGSESVAKSYPAFFADLQSVTEPRSR